MYSGCNCPPRVATGDIKNPVVGGEAVTLEPNQSRHSLILCPTFDNFATNKVTFSVGSVRHIVQIIPFVPQKALFLTRADFGGTIAGQVSVSCSEPVVAYFAEISGMWCDCDCCDYESMYDAKLTTQTIAGSNVMQKALGLRSLRRTLVVSTAAAGLILVGVNADATGVFYVSRGPFAFSLPYRDYGPLITGEIWVSSNTPGDVVNVTEVYEIPRP